LSNIGDLLGMRMYSTSCGTISASHKSLTKRDRRLVSMDNSNVANNRAL